MMEFIKNSAFFGAMLSLIAYEIGLILKKKFKMAIFNPLLISIICVIGVLVIFHIDYNDYNEGGKYISYLLTPATVCLAVPLYEQIHLLKKNLKAVAAGIISGNRDEGSVCHQSGTGQRLCENRITSQWYRCLCMHGY